MARRLFTAAEKADIVRRIAAGEDSPTIAQDYGVHKDTPRRLYYEQTGAHSTPHGDARLLSPQVRERVLALVAEGILADREIAQVCGCSRVAVYHYRRRRSPRVRVGNGERVTIARTAAPPAVAAPAAPAAPEVPPREQAAAAVARAKARRPASFTPTPPPPPLPPPPATSGHPRPRATLSNNDAHKTATTLEHLGWRAEALPINSGVAIVEVRDLAVRCKPLIATLRTPEDVVAFFKEHPGHGLKGRVPSPESLGMQRAPHSPNTWLSPVTVGTP